MKYFFLIVVLCLANITFGQINNSINDSTNVSNPNYDKALAEKLGGGDYGMKSYYFVLLKTGASKNDDKDFINKCFAGHMENIGRLVKAGKLIVAGPFGKNDKTYRGIFILNNIKTIDEAKELLLTDPAIKNALLDYEIYPWYGSAALPEYLPSAEKIWRKN